MKSFRLAVAMVLVLACTCIFSSCAVSLSEKREQEGNSLVLEHQQAEEQSKELPGNFFAPIRIKRHSHLHLCHWCCGCCRTKGCRFCCRF